MRRTHFIAPLTDVISGVKPIPAFTRVWRLPHARDQKARETEIQVQYAVVDRIRRTRSLTVEEFTHARSRALKPLKVTLPSPLMMTLRWSPEYSREAYPDPFELFADAADIVRQEARELAAIGCEHIQIDAPELGMLCDPQRRRGGFRRTRYGFGALVADGGHRNSELGGRRRRRNLLDSICAAATTGVTMSARAATRRSPSKSSSGSATTRYCCWSMTTGDREPSSRCGWLDLTSRSCWD